MDWVVLIGACVVTVILCWTVFVVITGFHDD